MQINRKELSAAVNAVSRFTNPRSPKPAMQCLQLEAKDSKMRIRGFGTYGSASVAIPCSNKLDVVVNAAWLCKTVDLLPDDEVELKELKNKLQIKGSSSKIDVPIYAMDISPETGTSGPKIKARASDVMRCIDIANVIGNNSEMHFANGVRICTSENHKLNFSSSTSKNSAFSWCDCEAGDIDVVVARGGIGALIKLLQMMDELTIEDRGSHVAFYSGDKAAILLKESMGKSPTRYDKVSSFWAGANKWRVSRDGLNEFIRYAMAVSTPEASGVWIKPINNGLLCQYTGLSDGTHALDLSVEATCETHVQGEACTGKDAYISCRLLAPALAALSDDGFLINAMDGHALILESKDAVIGLGQLNPPTTAMKEQKCD